MQRKCMSAMIYFVIVTSFNALIVEFCTEEDMQCIIAGPPSQCCRDLNCSPQMEPELEPGYGVCRKGI